MVPRSRLLAVLPLLAGLAASTARAQDFEGVVFGPGGPGGPRNEFAALTRGATEHNGYLKLYQKDDKLYAELQPQHFDKPMLCPIAIARGAGMGGYTLNFDEQWVLLFKRYGDKVHLIRRNVRFKASSGGPTAKAVETTYTDSVLLALRVVTTNPQRGSVLINLGDIFMQNFAELPMGMFDASRSTWHKVKAFPGNIEIEVAATFAGGRGMMRGGDDSVIDARGKTVVIHYGLCPLPEGGYTPRIADDRVGYFLTATKDFSNDSKDTSFVRYVNRWRLEPADTIDPKNPEKLSDPKKKIVFWIEKSVPTQYRAAVREGILEWNKAFEKIGFRDAIEVRQQENEEFDPEDIHYNTFRWITTDMGFAMGPSRANPLTGEILDADIIFDASMVRFWKQDYKVQRGGGNPTASLIEATKNGWGLDNPLIDRVPGAEDAPQGWNQPRQSDGERHALAGRLGLCQCGAQMKYEMGLAAMALADAAPVPADKPGEKPTAKPNDKQIDELIKQAIKYVTMHEVGHTLGLRHNFKASTMLPNDKLHDKKLTREKGLVGSVMDYTPINLAPKGVTQGDYFSTTLGPYDYWAIEYAYTTDNAALKDIAKKGGQPGHDYATDEDMRQGADPLVHVWDLGADPMKFAMDRVVLAEDLLKGLGDRVVEKGEGYQRARQAFHILLGQFGNGAYLVSNYVGGESIYRDHRDDPNARDPMTPIKGDKQREALKFLRERILTDATFQFSPKLLRQLAADRWNHWGSDMEGPDFPVYEEILNIQKVVLRNLLKPDVLARVQNNALKVENGEKALALDEVFRALTDGIWADLSGGDGNGKPAMASSVIRRNLQREHLKELTTLVLGKRTGVPPDARSLARMHLKEMQGSMLAVLKNQQMGLDATTRAHLEECQERIGKTLNASMTVTE
ncbi:MAG: zinc-dependent metalloprotease [Gemmataceae bacterium]